MESSKPCYHVVCYPRFFDSGSRPDFSESSPPHIIDVMQQFIEDNPHEQQFSLKKIIYQVQGGSVNNQWLKKKLYERLGDDIVITSNPGSEPIIQLRDTSHRILLKHFQDSQDTTEGHLKIIKSAAKIIKNDIRSMECDTTSYPPPESFLENVATIIPESLKVFLDDVITADKNGVGEGNYFPKIVAIAHTIISCVRPRSFLSCLKIGLGAVLNRKFGSKTLLNILSSLGFSCSYKEALLFEASVISQPNNSTIDAESFSQFAFDNADHNINTVDGLNTFHAMGGIECVAPKSAVSCGERIAKLTSIPSENIIATFGKLDLKHFHGYKKAGLGNVPVENLNQKDANVQYDFDISTTDLMWIFNHKIGCVEKEDWNGFMEK